MTAPDLSIRRQGGGFTLLELLVSVGVIIVFISLSLVMTGKMRESSAQSKCASQMRQLHVAVMQHALDHNGYLIPSDSGSNPKNGMRANIRWYQRIWPGVLKYASPLTDYIEGEALGRISVCPNNAEQFTGHTVDGIILKSQFGWPYAVNSVVIVSSARSDDGRFVRLLDLKNPAQTPMMSDSRKGSEWGQLWEGSFVPHPNQSRIGTPHGGKTNVVWMDGHISTMTREELLSHIVEMAAR